MKTRHKGTEGQRSENIRHTPFAPLSLGPSVRLFPFSFCLDSGYTLLEMLLVLVVLLAVASVAWPRLERLYADRQLKQTAEELRVKLTGARLHSIDAALIYQFRYEPGGRRFLIVPYERDVPQTRQTGANDVAGPDECREWNHAGELPEDIQFQTPDDQDAETEKVAQEWLNGLPDAGELAATVWSAPLLYYPDGSATDAALELIDSDRQSVRLAIRGLTGAASLSRVHRETQR